MAPSFRPPRPAVLIIVSLATLAALPRAAARDEVQELVRAWVGPAAALDADDWSRLAGGQPLAMMVDATQSAEMSAVGAIRIGVTPEVFVERFRRIEQIERGSTVQQIAKFGATATMADVSRLTLDAEDVERMVDCLPGDCGMQLPERVIAETRTALASAQDPAGLATDIFRRHLVSLVQAYRTRGDAALEPYVDRREPLSVVAAFEALDTGRRVLAARVPAIARDLAGYPRTRPPGSQEFFYWSKLRFGFKPTVRVNHVLLCPVQNHPGGLRYVIVSKQLYASHYFDAALEWRMIVEDPETGGSVLVYRTDVRSRSLTGFTASLFRGIVRSRARGGLERYLLTIKKSMEAPPASLTSDPLHFR